MKPRAFKLGESQKPVRVRLEKDGKPYGSVTTYPVGWAPPDVGEPWGDGLTVVSGRPGTGDDEFEEVILIVGPKPEQIPSKPSE